MRGGLAGLGGRQFGRVAGYVRTEDNARSSRRASGSWAQSGTSLLLTEQATCARLTREAAAQTARRAGKAAGLGSYALPGWCTFDVSPFCQSWAYDGWCLSPASSPPPDK